VDRVGASCEIEVGVTGLLFTVLSCALLFMAWVGSGSLVHARDVSSRPHGVGDYASHRRHLRSGTDFSQSQDFLNRAPTRMSHLLCLKRA
jgi:hypothetical protein